MPEVLFNWHCILIVGFRYTNTSFPTTWQRLSKVFSGPLPVYLVAFGLALQAKLDSINCTHGDAHTEETQPRPDTPQGSPPRPTPEPGSPRRPAYVPCHHPHPPIKKSPCVALPSLTKLILTCLNSCRTILISTMLQRERLTD